jgi:hypothetical protein
VSYLPLIIFLGCVAMFVYRLADGPQLWGPERGVPFCRHPFDLAQGRRWCCPLCSTAFVFDERANRWLPERR